MDMAGSDGYAAAAVAPASLGRGLIRWAVLGAAGVIALVLALSHGMVAGAQTPNCVAINYTTCVTNVGYTAPGTVYTAPINGVYGGFNGNVVATNIDPRYCGGVVYVVNEGGNLIDRCPDGTRVVPVFPDYGIGGLYGSGFIGANYLNGYVNNGFIGNGAFCGGLYGCPGAFNNFNGFYNGGAFGAFPAGATPIGGGVYTYKDNRYCGDGNLFFVVGRGSACQNGTPLFANGNYAAGYYSVFEVTQPTTAPAAAPVAAPVAAQAAPVAAPAAVQSAPVVAAPAQMPTALTAPQVQTPDAAATGGSNVHVLSASPATTPAATGVGGSDDHR